MAVNFTWLKLTIQKCSQKGLDTFIFTFSKLLIFNTDE